METEEMADLVLELYVQGGRAEVSDDDGDGGLVLDDDMDDGEISINI